jgi:putative aldouronate transport system substrate-binding protein
MLGFMMDIEPVRMEMMNCRSVLEKYKNDLLTGASDPDEILPQLILELKNNGLDKVMAEAQRQIDALYK